MSTAFGRLWIRAPLWRRTVIATGAALALAFAFPPTLPLAPQMPTPRAPANPATSQVTGVPVAGTLYAGHLPLGAQSVPLPPGRWLTLAVRNIGVDPSGGPPNMSAFLGLTLAGRIAAVAIISGSIAPEPLGSGFAPPLNLEIPSFYYRRVLSAVDHGALDLWLCGPSQPSQWNDPLSQAAIGVIRQQGLSLADHFASVVFRLADRQNWISANFMYPDLAPANGPVRPWTEAATLPDTSPISHNEKVRRWGKAWHETISRGFAGTLRPGEEAHIPLPY